MRSGRSIPALLACIFLFTILPLSGAMAAEGREGVYTLERSIEEAMANSWRLRGKAEKIQQARYAMNQAKSSFLPKLGTTYSYTRLNEAPTQGLSIPGSVERVTVGTADNYTWTGFLTQPIFTGFALVSSYRLSQLGIDQSELEFELGKLDLALNVKTAYFNILVADKGVEVAEKQVESLKSNLKVARSFFNVGMIPINDVLKAEVELASAEQDLVKATTATRLTRSSFNTILVRPINEPVEVEDILTYKPEKADYDALIKKALSDRPELKVLDVNLLQADQQIRLAKSKNYPEVSLNYQYIKKGDSPDVSGSPFVQADSWQVTASMTWTFWEWGKTYYSTLEQESLKKQLIETRSDVEDGIRLEVKQALLDLEVADKNIPTTQKAIEQAEENLRVNEERYKAQVTTITEVLDAQALLTRARVDHYRALYDQNLAKARLERAAGAY